MVPLSEIRAQPRAIGFLHRALETGRLAHAYLFAGPAGCGKHTTALALAAAVNCQNAPGQGCNDCDSCTKIDHGTHPDVVTLEREGAARIIPIQTVRTRVIPSLAMPPHEGRARFFLIEEANALQGPAANALLKTLEEPPPRTHFIFGTSAPDKLLPTIRSRCQRVPFAELPPDIRAEIHSDNELAETLGDIVTTVCAAAEQSDLLSLNRAAEAVCEEKTQIVPALELLAHRLHERAVQAAFAGDLDSAARLGRQAISAMDTATAVGVHNAHGLLSVESLLHRLRGEAA